MLKKIFFTIFSLSVIFLIPTYSVSALENTNIVFDEQMIQSLYNTINTYQYNGSTLGPYFCQNGLAIIWDNTNTTYKVYCNNNGYFSSQVNSNNVLPPLDKTSNYLGLTNFTQFQNFTYTGGKSPSLILYYDIHDGWLTQCVYSGCTSSTYTLNSGDYVYAFLDFYPNNNKTKGWVYNKTENDTLFNVNYNNFYYYSSLNNWSENSYTYLLSPDIVLGSHDSFDSEELTSVPSPSYSNYNNYMYTIDSVDDSFSLLGVTFGYNYYSDNNYKLGFVLTYKKATDTPPLVYAQTNIGTYACNLSSVKSKNDSSYQWYVECPSVAFSNDENEGYLYIMVQGGYDFVYTTGPAPIYDFNNLFYANAGVVGISPILKSVTSVPPSPVGPGGDTPDDIISGIDDIIDSLNNPNVDDITDIFDDFNENLATNSVISDLLLLPITIFNNILTNINGTCSPFILGTIKGYTISLPCINVSLYLGSTLWTSIDLIFSGMFVLVIRKRFVDMFNDMSSLKDRGNVLE